MRLPRGPWCEFCRTADGAFNFDEHHAICLGLLSPLFLWPFLLKLDEGWIPKLVRHEPWYIAFGTTLRLGALILIAWGLL